MSILECDRVMVARIECKIIIKGNRSTIMNQVIAIIIIKNNSNDIAS